MLEQQPTRLTIDGIIQLIQKQSSFQGQIFILQVLTLSSNYLGHHYTELSDGFCKVQCQLGQKVKALIESQKLLDNGLIRFSLNDCEVIADNPNPYIVLQNCEVIKSQISKTIGAPMPYKLYKQKNYQNPEASNLIESGPRTYTIREIINNTRIKNGHIRAIVTKLPINTSRGLFIFHMKDSEGTQIQGVCFEQAVDLFLKELKINRQYLFSGFILNKNKKTNQDELKFKKQGQIIHIIKNEKGESFVKTQQLIKKEIEPSSQPFLSHTEQNQDQQSVTKLRLVQMIKEDKIEGKFFTIVGKVTYINFKNKFRKINIQDKNNDIIDLLLWEQIKDSLTMERIYKFTELRIKNKPDIKYSRYFQLQSTQKTTISSVEPLEFQLMTVQQPKTYDRKQKYQTSHVQDENYLPQTTIKLPEGSKIISIQELINFNENQSNEENPICQCTIKFRTQGLRFKEETDTLSYFNFFCKPCGKAGSASLGDNQIVFCNRCKRDDIQIKWNLRVRVMDFHNELPCSIQSETTQRLLNLSPKQGYLMFMQSKQNFEKLLHRINFDYRICKFQIKTYGMNKYYNIQHIYAKDAQIILNRHMDAIKQLLKNYYQIKLQ